MSEVTGFSILFAAVGLLFIGLGIPLIMGRVPPNHLYGCRTVRTLADPKLWYEANRVSGKYFLASGVLVSTVSLVTLVFGRGLNPNQVVVAFVSILILSVAGAARHCLRVGRRGPSGPSKSARV